MKQKIYKTLRGITKAYESGKVKAFYCRGADGVYRVLEPLR